MVNLEIDWPKYIEFLYFFIKGIFIFNELYFSNIQNYSYIALEDVSTLNYLFFANSINVDGFIFKIDYWFYCFNRVLFFFRVLSIELKFLIVLSYCLVSFLLLV